MKNFILYSSGLLLLLATEFLHVYFIMPFPGSQKSNTLEIAYFIHNWLWFFRMGGFALLLVPLKNYLAGKKNMKKLFAVLPLLFYFFLFYNFNYGPFTADHRFYQPETKLMLTSSNNKVDVEKIVMGVSLNGESKAYPVEIMGYHHQVRDTVGGIAVMVTYCTVCRTGRVFSPFVKGEPEQFRLVGMDHFNAMFEDSETKSWWMQATGEAAIGPLRGERLEEIFSEQMTLKNWISLHPETTILQPDPKFSEKYADLNGFDRGKLTNSLEYTDTNSWKKKSWIIGIQNGATSKAYDWKSLLKLKLLNDAVGNSPVLILVETDSISYHVFSRELDEKIFSFSYSTENSLTDNETKSTWTMSGKCIDGEMKGKQLQVVQSSLEYWHSWKEFHPNTLRFE